MNPGFGFGLKLATTAAMAVYAGWECFTALVGARSWSRAVRAWAAILSAAGVVIWAIWVSTS